MTLATTTNRIAYQGNGSTVAYPIPFRFFATSDIRLYFDDALCSTGFTITGAGVEAGGTLTFTSPPPDDTDLVITRVLTLTQSVDLGDHDALPATALEQNGLDRVVMLIQQVDDKAARAVLLDESSCYSGLTLPEPEANLVLAWKTDLSGLENVVGGATGATGATGPQGPPGAGAAPTITDCSTSVTVPETLWIVGSGVTVAVTQPHTTPKVAKLTLTVATPTVAGQPSLSRFTATNNASTSTRDLDMAGCGATLWIPGTGATLTTANALTKTVNTATAGPAANGRDQAGAFSAGSWLYFYYIAKADGTVDGIVSAVPPTTGPTLPATYLYWVFATAVYYTGASELTQVYARGRVVWVKPAEAVLTGAGTGAQETIDISARVPTIAESSAWTFYSYDVAAPRFRVVTNVDFGLTVPNIGGAFAMHDVDLPYVSSNIYYIQTTANARAVWFRGYRLPNG